MFSFGAPRFYTQLIIIIESYEGLQLLGNSSSERHCEKLSLQGSINGTYLNLHYFVAQSIPELT